MARFAPRFNVIGIPCNQFGHQMYGDADEVYNTLKYVRPGNGFVPNFPILERVDAIGENTAPIFKALRAALPYAEDRPPEKDMAEPYGIMKPANAPAGVLRTPSDLLWNFEKFLVDARGVPRHRFSPKFPAADLAPYIEALLKEAESA